jgi:hypothetical protein
MGASGKFCLMLAPRCSILMGGKDSIKCSEGSEFDHFHTNFSSNLPTKHYLKINPHYTNIYINIQLIVYYQQMHLMLIFLT